MKLEIFDVEHGASALLTCDDQTRLMIDCGHNASTQWHPGDYLSRLGVSTLDMLAVTNYDEDHVSGIENLFGRVNVSWLLRNRSVTPEQIKSLKSETGMGRGIEYFVDVARRYLPSSNPLPSFQGMTYQTFCNTPATFDDENNLSLALSLKCHGFGVMFTGDLEIAGMRKLMERADFCLALRDTNVFVAPHHGRESGCCEELIGLCNPHYVVISDKGYEHETQETNAFYRRMTKGGPFRGETRHILTTRRDGSITFEFDPGRWGPR